MHASLPVFRSPRPRLRVAGCAMLALLGVLACGDHEANEARLFLDRYDALEHPDLHERRVRVDAFRRLAFRSERVKAAHEVCARVHEALLRAEEKSVEARRLLERLESLPPPERPADLPQRIEASLAASQDAADEAAAQKTACDRALADLRTRHAPRR